MRFALISCASLPTWVSESMNFKIGIKLRSSLVQVNRLGRWHRPGSLCIGDAAHAMSRAGGVAINLAIQDAIAAANLFTQPLLDRSVAEAHLAAVQKRREFPTALTQAIQLLAHRGLARVFENSDPIRPPWQLKVVTRVPGIQRASGYAVGIGVRREQVQEKTQERPRRSSLRRGVALAIVTAGAGWLVWRRRKVSAQAAGSLSHACVLQPTQWSLRSSDLQRSRAFNGANSVAVMLVDEEMLLIGSADDGVDFVCARTRPRQMG